MQLRSPPIEIANLHQHPFGENGVYPVKIIPTRLPTHLPTHSKQHTLDTHCKPSPDNKFLEASTLTTIEFTSFSNNIYALFIFKKHTLLYMINCNLLQPSVMFLKRHQPLSCHNIYYAINLSFILKKMALPLVVDHHYIQVHLHVTFLDPTRYTSRSNNSIGSTHTHSMTCLISCESGMPYT